MVLTVVTFWPIALRANTCIAPKPVKVSGAVCGRVIYPDGSSATDARLRVLDETGAIAADVRTDSKADFLFLPLAKGKYRLTTTSASFNIRVWRLKL
jgi:hypothetical protein